MLVKRGDLAIASKSFPELVNKYHGNISKVLEAAFKGSLSKIIGPGLNPFEKRMYIEYILSVTKLLLPMHLSKLHQIGDETISAAALKIFEATPDASDLFAACVAYGLDPVHSQVRLTNSDVNYVQATMYYTYRGTAAECHQGFTITTSLATRRDFTIFLPHQQLSKPRYDVSRAFTERRRDVRM